MSEEESAKQMHRAFYTFVNEDKYEDTSSKWNYVLMPNRDEEQPVNFDNREIRNLTFEQLIQGLSHKN